jgi:hypothetical protein
MRDEAFITKNHKVIVTFDENSPRECWGRDSEGEFGCKKLHYMAAYSIPGHNEGHFPIIRREKEKGLFDLDSPVEYEWVNHFWDCPFASRFRNMHKKKK